MTLLEGLYIKVVAFFHFLAVFLAWRFTLMAWSLVWFLHQLEQQLLVFWNTQQQIDSGLKCSLRTFFYFLPFHMLSWGRPMVKAQGNLPVWSFNDSLTTVVCPRTGLDSSHACGEHSTNLCTGVQGSGDLIFKWLQSSNSTYQFVVECWNFTKVKKKKLKKMGVSLSVFFLLVTQCCNIYIGKLS